MRRSCVWEIADLRIPSYWHTTALHQPIGEEEKLHVAYLLADSRLTPANRRQSMLQYAFMRTASYWQTAALRQPIGDKERFHASQ